MPRRGKLAREHRFKCLVHIGQLPPYATLRLARFLTRWVIRATGDQVVEPTAGDAAFLVAAVAPSRTRTGCGFTSEHSWRRDPCPHSADVAEKGREAGDDAFIRQSDFFVVEPEPAFDAFVGNPPYIRCQDFTGETRARAREAAVRGGISLNRLASSWAAFTVRFALYLRQGGRLNATELVVSAGIGKNLFHRVNPAYLPGT
ncbi:hypothetical protein J2Z50_004687 [Ensifer mexicanus]|nr:hypothetical protein [Sinorhizobium mexicanum]